MHQSIPVVDIFAGPGGLSEGFSSLEAANTHPFKVIFSAEMDETAIMTLRLRAFVRWFVYGQRRNSLPQVYTDYVHAKNAGDKTHPALFLRQLLNPPGDKLANFNPEKPPEEFVSLLIAPLSGKTEKNWQAFKDHVNDQDELNAILRACEFAINEAIQIELGSTDKDVHALIKKALSEQCKNNVKQPFVLIGGPPCQAYSSAGRSRRKGSVSMHLNDEGEWDQDNDPRSWLYREYLKILHKDKPAIFVMENVRGMLSAEMTNSEGQKEKAWKMIVRDLHKPGVALNKAANSSDVKPSDSYLICSLADSEYYYDGSEESLVRLSELPRKLLIRASEFGVPQNRDRVILVGIRRDLLPKGQYTNALKRIINAARSKAGPPTTVYDAIADLPPSFSFLTNKFNGTDKKRQRIKADKDNHDRWMKTVDAYCARLVKKLARVALKSPHSLERKQYANILQSLKNTRELMQKWEEAFIEKIQLDGYVWPENETKQQCSKLLDWYGKESGGLKILNHAPRGHMDTDLARYLFATCFSLASRKLFRKGIKVRDQVNLSVFEKIDSELLVPAHKNKKSFVDRFKVQIADKAASTVTSHISKDGHYFIHPDPVQCRSLTVREAARLQTFPDNYYFEGERTKQFHQVGNAVPPLLANQIAEVVLELWKALITNVPNSISAQISDQEKAALV